MTDYPPQKRRKMVTATDGSRVKTAHVNMMTDTIISNISSEGLRVVLRSLLASHPEITASFEAETRNYIRDVALPKISKQATEPNLSVFKESQKTIRCMLGCGLGHESVALICELASQAVELFLSPGHVDGIEDFLASIDGDIVQLVTAVEKTLTAAGRTELSHDEKEIMNGLEQSLMLCQERTGFMRVEYPYPRAMAATSVLLGGPTTKYRRPSLESTALRPPPAIETFELNNRTLPRIFTGLWQMSSPSWGSAPNSKILAQFSRYVDSGLVAFDMADHYGDAEIVFGECSLGYLPGVTFAATKYCVFNPMKVIKEAVQANVSERCRRLQSNKIDLLQFHWQFYEDPQYIDALRFLAEDPRVFALGLCNFDTEHLQNVLYNGIKVHSNQVQFSLIDSRPVIRMGKICEQHNIKLLTYGTLCGGFLAEKWLGKDEPNLYAETITPSQRKYYAMIRSWGGWTLFQELLRTLKRIASKHGKSLSTVAIRWVLDFPYVGAVIVGARMGISEHMDDNTAGLGWSLDEKDRASIEEVLKKSKRLEVFEDMGDCGGEYR